MEYVKFDAELKACSTEVLQDIQQKIIRELSLRLRSASLEPFTDEERKMTKIVAIQHYRKRTECDLSTAMEAYRRYYSTKDLTE